MRLARVGTVLVAAAAAALLLHTPAGASTGEELARAISLAADERHDEAREVLDPVLEREPAHPQARLLDGILRAREGRVGEAMAIFDRLHREHPEMPEPRNNLAVLLAVEGRFIEARDALESALEHQPDLAAAHANLGDVYSELARLAYARARSLAPAGGGETWQPTLKYGKEAKLPAPARVFPAPRPAQIEASPLDEDESRPQPPPRAAAAPAPAAATGREPARSSSDEGRRRPRVSLLKLPGVSAPTDSGSLAAPPRAGGQAPGPVNAGAATTATAAAPSMADTEPGPPAACFRATGFEDASSMAQAEAWLRMWGAETVASPRSEHRAGTHHRVYLPPFSSRAEAEAAVREIRARGEADVALIGTGPLQNGVSLGVYREAKNALRRVAAFEALGYPVRHDPGGLEAAAYVLEARTRGDALAELNARWSERFPGRALEIVDCG